MSFADHESIAAAIGKSVRRDPDGVYRERSRSPYPDGGVVTETGKPEGLAIRYRLSDETWEKMQDFRDALSEEVETFEGQISDEDEGFTETQRGINVAAWVEDLQAIVDALSEYELDREPDEPDED